MIVFFQLVNLTGLTFINKENPTTFVCLCICMCVCFLMYRCVCVCKYVRIYTCICMNIYTHIYYTNVSTKVQS